MIPYDVQLIWWIMIHQGKMAEMRTGEGKTLVATLPCYLNALEEKWVHVVTVNDYLASRDAERMAHVYNRLGLSVWSVVKWSPLQWRREQYEKDITYVENSELWFDYLRDNLAKSMPERNMLWRPLHYAIIDEVDSILIDEARTPLIISQASGEPTEKYQYYAQIVKSLTPSKTKKKISKWFLAELMKDGKQEEEQDDSGDYFIDEKTKSATLSSAGIMKLEKMLKVDNLYKDLGFTEIHHIENALKAQAVYNKDKEYLVRDGQVMIVDDNTWRVMPGRRFSQWLHQAIEAKEKVEIKRESKTLASITYQHFFKQYNKLSGMTGTALTEAEEFESIYESDTITIPTNKPILRVDKQDAVYFNQKAKWNAVTDHIKFYHTVWVPILIGTSSIQTSEFVSQFLTKSSLVHSVLNAKFHEQEAQTVKNAGKKWSIVVATNMAWRGTDIKLSKELNWDIAQWYARYIKKVIDTGNSFVATVYSEIEYNQLQQALEEAGVSWNVSLNGKKSAAELVAMDDEIMRKMWWDKIQSIAGMMMSKEELETMEFTQKQFTDSIQRAQKQMEGRHYGIRKQLFEYDSVINKQRASIYKKRDEILEVGWSDVSDNAEKEWLTTLEEVKTFIPEIVKDLTTRYTSYAPWNTAELSETLAQITWLTYDDQTLGTFKSSQKLTSHLADTLSETYDNKFTEFEDNQIQQIVKRMYLWVIDKYRMEHIDEMSYLREKVSLWSYAQQDPLVIYKREAYDKFQWLLSIIKQEALSQTLKTDFSGLQDADQIQAQLQQQAQSKGIDMMDVLKHVAWQAKAQPKEAAKEKDLSSTDDIQVIEITDDGNVAPEVVFAQPKKIRPNDKVNIKHPDGRIEYGVKWKKVKNDVEDGKVSLV